MRNAGAATGEMVNRGGAADSRAYYGGLEAEAEWLRQGRVLDRRPGLSRPGGLLLLRWQAGATGCPGGLRRTSAAGPVEAVLSLATLGARWPPSTACPIPGRATRSWPHPRTGPRGRLRSGWPSPTGWPSSTTWAPSGPQASCACCPTLPQTASGKVTKVVLEAEGWWAPTDPVVAPGSHASYRLGRPRRRSAALSKPKPRPMAKPPGSRRPTIADRATSTIGRTSHARRRSPPGRRCTSSTVTFSSPWVSATSWLRTDAKTLEEHR